MDVDTKYPNTKKLIFDLENRGADGANGGIHARKWSNCIPLHFCSRKRIKRGF